MSEKLEQLKARLGEVFDIGKAASVLSWDQQVHMPPGGTEARGRQLATLNKLAQEKLIADEVGRLIEDLQQEYDSAQTDKAALVRVAARNYSKARRVPPDFIAEREIVTANAFEAWVEAREKSDFSIFAPHLEKVLEIIHEYISFFPAADHPYDTLLDDYERGMKTAEVQAIFADLRPRQVELLDAIASGRQVKADFLFKKYNEKKLDDFGRHIITAFGYDWSRGRQDKAPHPFQTTFSVNDVRITTRYEDENPMAILFSTMHEAGHALYEQGVDQAFERTPLASGTSLAVHESQSRMWENLVGRSLPFWDHFYPHLKKLFPAQLGGVSLKSFYRAINRVEPSLIRVNADEATYNLHIMLRLELEIDLVQGRVAIRDLPAIWNAKMQDYLGITPPDDSHGVLQDIHWSLGSIGYFSTYALGNLVSAQLWEKINQDIPTLDDQIRKGDFAELLDWLRRKVHRHGQKYEPQALIEMATGSKITSEPYVRYLTKKYGEIYGL